MLCVVRFLTPVTLDGVDFYKGDTIVLPISPKIFALQRAGFLRVLQRVHVKPLGVVDPGKNLPHHYPRGALRTRGGSP